MASLIAPSQDGLMVGFPPPPDKRITTANSHLPAHLGWLVQNPGRLFPIAPVSRGEGPVTSLPAGEPAALDVLTVDDGQGARLPMTEIWQRTGVDSMLVLHRGKIVFERYFGDMTSTRQHAFYSCTKSVVGLLVEALIHEGAVDPGLAAAHYVPELQDSPAGHATVRQLLDMQAHFMFSDRPKVDGQVQVDYLMGLGFMPRLPGYAGPNGAYELLIGARPMGPHGGAFRYDNGSTDTLGWILRRVRQSSLDALVGQAIWSRLGCEQNAGFTLDAAGTEWAGGGLSACLRDFARLGEMLRGQGHFNGQQILPQAIFEAIQAGGDREAFADGAGVPTGGSYRSQFWITHDRHGSYAARGQFGQRLWVAPKADLVIAQFAADPNLAALEPLRLRGFQAIADLYR